MKENHRLGYWVNNFIMRSFFSFLYQTERVSFRLLQEINNLLQETEIRHKSDTAASILTIVLLVLRDSCLDV